MNQQISGPATQPSTGRAGGVSDPGLVSVVVPVVERMDDLADVFRSYAAELQGMGVPYEFLFVFDGGFEPPKTLSTLANDCSQVRILKFQHRFGEAMAIRAGIEHSRGDVILTVPAYFQVQPHAVRGVLTALRDGADVVVTRREPRVDAWVNRLQSAVFHGLIRQVTDVSFRDMACGLRALRREAAEAIPIYGDLHRFIPALASREGYAVQEVPAPQHPLDSRRRIYAPGVYLRRILDVLTFFFLAKFTEKPLRFFGLVGSVVLGAGGAICLIVVVQRLTGTSLSDRPMLLLGLLLIVLGVQALGLGLVGEIIVHLRSPHRRAYRIRDVVGSASRPIPPTPGAPSGGCQ